jgi:hypothetical protein
MGRARLIDELREDGVNVAFPTCAGEIDLLAYVDSRIAACTVVSVPIKVVSFRSDASSSNLDAARASGLLIALVWDISNPAHVRTFALTRAAIANLYTPRSPVFAYPLTHESAAKMYPL